MKKILGNIGIALLIAGCAGSNVAVDKKINEVNIDKILMKKYHITTNNLIKFGDYYVFYTPGPNGTDIVFLNKNYKEVKRFSTPYFLDTKKIAVANNKIYVLGVNEESYFPELLILDKNGKLIKKDVFAKKYALPKDMYIDKDIFILIDIFNNGKSFIEIYKNGKLLKKIKLKNSLNGNFVFKDGNDLFVIGTIKGNDENAFISNITKGWIRFFDLGMDEMIDSFKIEGNKIILNLHSTDEMGADSYYKIVIDKNGKILENKCKIKFAPLPMRFRT